MKTLARIARAIAAALRAAVAYVASHRVPIARAAADVGELAADLRDMPAHPDLKKTLEHLEAIRADLAALRAAAPIAPANTEPSAAPVAP